PPGAFSSILPSLGSSAGIEERLGRCGVPILDWLICVDTYRLLRAAGTPFGAIKYEGLLCDPASTIKRMLEQCDVSSRYAARMIQAMAPHSQRGTSLRR